MNILLSNKKKSTNFFLTMAVYIWSFIYLPLGNAFWITLFIPQTKFLCLYWLCNLKTKGVDAIFWYLVNQIQTSAAEHVHMEIDMIVSVDSKWWYVSMIYLEDSVHYGVFWCPCDFMKIVVFIKKKMWTACEDLDLWG